jgi:hypothetical protein
MFVILLIVAIGTTAIGCMMLSQATLGVGIVGSGCFLAILARMAQAQSHHQALMDRLASLRPEPPAPEA